MYFETPQILFSWSIWEFMYILVFSHVRLRVFKSLFLSCYHWCYDSYSNQWLLMQECWWCSYCSSTHVSVGLKQFSFVLSVYLFLTVQSSHESSSSCFSYMKVLFWLEHHDWSCSQPEPPVKTVRKLSNVAPDVFLDCSMLLMPSCKTWKPMFDQMPFLCKPKITCNCFLILRFLSLHHPHTPKTHSNTSTHPHIHTLFPCLAGFVFCWLNMLP